MRKMGIIKKTWRDTNYHATKWEGVVAQNDPQLPFVVLSTASCGLGSVLELLTSGMFTHLTGFLTVIHTSFNAT